MYQQENNKLIEELMILANICAAEEVKIRKKNVYRVIKNLQKKLIH